MDKPTAAREARRSWPVRSLPIVESDRSTASSSSTPILPAAKRKVLANSNAFDKSFAQALKRTRNHSRPGSLLESEDNTEADMHTKPLRTVNLIEKRTMLSAKTNPSLGICLWHELSHNLQYTRPVVDILREVLDVGHPMAVLTKAGGDVQTG